MPENAATRGGMPPAPGIRRRSCGGRNFSAWARRERGWVRAQVNAAGAWLPDAAGLDGDNGSRAGFAYGLDYIVIRYNFLPYVLFRCFVTFVPGARGRRAAAPAASGRFPSGRAGGRGRWRG